MATMQHKKFCVRVFIKTESPTAVQRAFRLCEPVQRAENLEWRNQLSGVVEAPFAVQSNPFF